MTILHHGRYIGICCEDGHATEEEAQAHLRQQAVEPTPYASRDLQFAAIRENGRFAGVAYTDRRHYCCPSNHATKGAAEACIKATMKGVQ